ncbi:probable cytochrome P450 6a23 [Euwallacea fornicatus]|uniref:probable cytochrome P450 6a23 n=1 Tax=Euwallacea fornicatus TaxID=995702 RepID=UPI00338DA14C
MSLLLIAVPLLLISLLLVLYFKWHYSYWKRRGVAQLNPEFFYGDLRGVFTKTADIGNSFKDIYLKFKDRHLAFGGVFWGFQPVFVPVDLDLIKQIMVKDFNCFQDRGGYLHEKDPLTVNLFRMEGEAWKNLRQKLSPTFTSSRMKFMFNTVYDKAELLRRAVQSHLRNGEGTLNVTDMSGRFTTDVIGSCAFGIECDSLNDPQCLFLTECKKINKPMALKQFLEHNFPRKLLGYTGYKSFPHVEEFFRTVVHDTMEYRQKHNVYRKDFMHFLLELRNKSTSIKSEDQATLTDDEILAQCFIFLVAGFDTSATTMTCALYELARKQDIQDQMREEMREILKKHGGKMTYEGLKELELTEKVILETLRKYPILPSIPRVCTKAYKVPNSDVILEKGTALQIPIRGIHMDPEFYPNPDEFNPERFSKEEVAKRQDFTHLPFGDGPRVCIGARFALMQAKAGLTGFLSDTKFTLAEGDESGELLFKPSMILLHPRKEIKLRIERA